jgi:hypothetical protein
MLIVSHFGFCQTKIVGTVNNNFKQTLTSVNVTLQSTIDDSVLAYCFSDEKGNYEFIIDKLGKYNLIFSALNYETKTIHVELRKEQVNIVENAILIYKPEELNEVIIQADRPLIVKKDTIVFDAKSFAQGNEQVVEDLLKKIPGITVSNEGVIKVGNQEIEKVMIDGDDFFEKGYKLLTKNMPANPIDKIELYQHYSNNKHLKGIENSDKVALNLRLKDDAKRQWFGNMQLGYGVVTENRYEVRGNLMNFGKKIKYYFLTNLNNIGEDATGDINDLIYSYSAGDQLGLGDGQSASSILGLNSQTPNLQQKRVNFNNAEMLSLNSIFTLSPKIKMKTLGFFNSDANDFFRNSLQFFTVGNTIFENAEDFKLDKTKITGFGKIDLTYDISKNMTLEFTSKFNRTNENSISSLIFNRDFLNENLKSNNQLIDQKIVFTNKFKEAKVFILSARYINEITPQNYSLNQFLYQDLFSKNADNVGQFSENKMQFAGFEGHLLDRKKNGGLLEIQFGNQIRKDGLASLFQLKDGVSVVDIPSNYQNETTYITNDLYLNLIYRFKFKKFGLLTQLDFHQLFNKLESFDSVQTQSPFFVNPKLGVEWDINKKNKIQTSYSFNTTNATLLDVNSNYIHTGFRSFEKGAGTFNQLAASTAVLTYTYGSWGAKFFANTFILYRKNYDFFSSNTLVTPNYSQSEKIVIKDREHLSLSSNLDRFLKPISSNLKLTFGGSKSNYKNIVNNSDLREVENNNINFGFEVRSGFSGLFNYHIGSKWDYNEVKTLKTNSFTDNMTFMDLTFAFTKKFTVQIQTERYYFGNLDKENNKYYFMDLDARYVVKENKLTFSLSGNNILNTKTFRNYSISDISISKTEYRLQPRYVLLKMEYRF